MSRKATVGALLEFDLIKIPTVVGTMKEKGSASRRERAYVLNQRGSSCTKCILVSLSLLELQESFGTKLFSCATEAYRIDEHDLTYFDHEYATLFATHNHKPPLPCATAPDSGSAPSLPGTTLRVCSGLELTSGDGGFVIPITRFQGMSRLVVTP